MMAYIFWGKMTFSPKFGPNLKKKKSDLSLELCQSMVYTNF